MTATITVQPQDSRAVVGATHTFSVSATGSGTLSYQWYLDGVAELGETSSTYTTLTAAIDNSYTKVTVVVFDDADNTYVTSDVAFAISTTPANNATRHSLVFNYDDNNFTWKDPYVEMLNDQGQYELFDITFQSYGFTPGWQERWNDYSSGGVSESTWEDAKAGAVNAVLWSETSTKGDSKQVMQIANGYLYQADSQINRQNSLKKYYVERTQMDLDDLNPEWTTNKIKQIKQFVFHMQSDQKVIASDRDNTIDFYVGWSNNLMEDPNWKPPVEISLEDRKWGGQYKIDYRSSGRYLAMHFDLTNTTQIAFTGGDMDAKEASGR